MGLDTKSGEVPLKTLAKTVDSCLQEMMLVRIKPNLGPKEKVYILTSGRNNNHKSYISRAKDLFRT